MKYHAQYEKQAVEIHAPRGALDRLLRTARYGLKPLSGRGYQVVRRIEPLPGVLPHHQTIQIPHLGITHGERLPFVQVPLPLAEVARHVLEGQGHSMGRHVPRSMANWPKPRHSDALTRFVAQNLHGLVGLGPGVSYSSVIERLAKAFPTLSILVVCPRTHDVFRLGRELEKRKANVSWAIGGHHPRRSAQIVITTFVGAGDLEAEVWLRRMVLVTHATAALGTAVEWTLSHAQRARIFGLLPEGAPLAPLDHDQLTSYFGLARFVLRSAKEVRPVFVVWRPSQSAPRLLGSQDVFAVKVANIWTNAARNRQVAARALGFQARGEAVVVLVESVDHLQRLSTLLPGWEVVTAPYSLQSHSPRAQYSASSQSNCVIATMEGLRFVGQRQFSVVIRADGGRGMPLNFDGLLAGTDPLLVIDFSDRFHPLLRQWSRKRRTLYLDAGWRNLQGDDRSARISRFLATRP